MRDKICDNDIIEALQIWQNSLYRLAYSYVRNADDAMDIVQESVYKALKYKNKLRDVDSLKPWLFRIVINTSLDFIKKQKLINYTQSVPEEGYEDDYQFIEVMEMLNTLDEKSREVIILHFFQDMTLLQVAETTNQKLSTVKSQLYRALKKLKIEFFDAENEKGHSYV